MHATFLGTDARHWPADSDPSLSQISAPPHTPLVTLAGERLPQRSIVELADALEIDRGKAETAARAAVPILFACLSIVASRPHGAQRLSRLLERRQMVSAEVVTDAGCHGGQRIAAAYGVGVLRELLGNQAVDSLKSAIADFSGTARHHAGLILGAVAVVVVDVLAERQRSELLSADALSRLLGQQSDQIVAAIPRGFSSRGTGLLGHLNPPGTDRRRPPLIVGKVQPRVAVHRLVPDVPPTDDRIRDHAPALTFFALALLVALFIAGAGLPG
jgi:hypothetical protein